MLLLACTPDPASSIDLPGLPHGPPPEADQEPPTPLWQRTGDEGILTVLRSAATRSRPQEVRVAGLFGEILEGPAFPAACGIASRLCIEDGASWDLDHFEPVPVQVGRQTWLGDHLQVGPSPIPFRVTESLAGYDGPISLDAPLLDRMPVGFSGGEWGTGQFEVAIPSLLTGLEPDAAESVPVDDTGLQVFRWAPAGGQIFLTMTGSTWSSTRRIEDDGAVWVDTREFRLAEPVEVRITRITEHGEVEIAGNRITLRGAVDQAWCMTDGCPTEPYDTYPRPMDFEFCWSATNCNFSSWRLEEDQTWTNGSFGGTWTYDCCSKRIDLFFPSGTRYWAYRDSNGCYLGEMLSWTGASGTWSACPGE